MRWEGFPNDELFAVDGIAWWNETTPLFNRLPARTEELVSQQVFTCGRQTSGVRVRFATDSTSIGISADFETFFSFYNMAAIGIFGISLWLDGVFHRVLAPKDAGSLQDVLVDSLPPTRREACIYLSSFTAIKLLSIGLDDEAAVWSPQPYSRSGKIVYYGQCVEQGIATSHSGLAYPSIIGRKLDMDFVNLGLSNIALGQPGMVSLLAEVDDASLFVLSFWQGFASETEMREAYLPFLRSLHERKPETPILCITPFIQLHELGAAAPLQKWRRQVTREAVAELQDAGAPVHLVEGEDLVTWEETHAYAERYHPNDIGHNLIAERLTPHLLRLLEGTSRDTT